MSSEYRVGDWVEIRTKEEILKTLDGMGQLEGLPFMPEMIQFCGRRFQVLKRAHKTCDTVFPTRGRRMSNSVHLDTRCDGQAHGGCEAACLLFWKETWVRPVDGPAANTPADSKGMAVDPILAKGTLQPVQPADQPAYMCQATQLPYYTSELPWWNFSQYLEDYTSGNASLSELMRGGVFASYYAVCQAGIGLGPILRWLYDRLHPLWRGTLFPRKTGTIPVGVPTPQQILNLQEGEIVRVKSHAEILTTINVDSKNRGMYWDAEMLPYCGGTYPVRKRVRTIIEEQTGKILTLKNEAIILEGVYCRAHYSCHRMMCPRSIFSYWREAWLERVSERKVDLRDQSPRQ